MKIYTITKDLILDALEEEPLGVTGHFDLDESPGHWSRSRLSDGVQLEPGCAVCAVGAVLRAAGCGSARDARFAVMGVVSCTADSLAEEGNYLQALSIVYEYLIENNRRAGLTVDEVRDHLTDWVEANVPDDYRLVAAASAP